jgi:hypothetical protein
LRYIVTARERSCKWEPPEAPIPLGGGRFAAPRAKILRKNRRDECPGQGRFAALLAKILRKNRRDEGARAPGESGRIPGEPGRTVDRVGMGRQADPVRRAQELLLADRTLRSVINELKICFCLSSTEAIAAIVVGRSLNRCTAEVATRRRTPRLAPPQQTARAKSLV